MTPVEVGLYDSEYAQILSGLNGDELVVSTWSSNLYEGAKIRLNDEEDSTKEGESGKEALGEDGKALPGEGQGAAGKEPIEGRQEAPGEEPIGEGQGAPEQNLSGEGKERKSENPAERENAVRKTSESAVTQNQYKIKQAV